MISLNRMAIVGAALLLYACQLTPQRRAHVLLHNLDAELLRNDSATATLERWCADFHLAEVPRIVAERIPGADRRAEPSVRQVLQLGAGESLRYRHVQLRCGPVPMSEADNWYVPARLTPAMNAVLEDSDEAFGRVVAPLQFKRRTLSSTLLWQAPGRAGSEIPTLVLEHRALLVLPDGRPISYVVERYRRETLGPSLR